MRSYGPAESISLVTDAVSGSGGVIVITTATAHGLSNNNRVYIDNVSGTTEANGFWVITSLTTTTFSLNGSAFANTFSGAGGVVYKGDRLRLRFSSTPATHMLLSYGVRTVSSIVSPSSVTRKLSGGTTHVLQVKPPGLNLYLDEISLTNPDNTTQSVFLEEELWDNTVVEHQRFTGVLQFERATWNLSAPNIIDPTGASRGLALDPLPIP